MRLYEKITNYLNISNLYLNISSSDKGETLAISTKIFLELKIHINQAYQFPYTLF